MIICVRGLGGNVATTLAIGTSLLSDNPGEDRTLGSVLAAPAWRKAALPPLSAISFRGWDIRGDSVISRAAEAGILKADELALVQRSLGHLVPRPAPVRPHDVSDPSVRSDQALPVSALAACAYYLDELEKLRAEDADIVAINLASTESINRAARDVTTVDEFYALVDGDSPVISGGIAFALACIEARVPYCDFTPDLTLECPALLQLARDQRMPVAGKDGNTGQTFLKLVLAEAIVKRNLGIIGWYSANVLGNLDGRVLTLPGHRETKLEDKLTALDSIVPYEFHHVVDIAFEPSRGDHKEAWDTVNLKGWLGRRVSLRVNWCASDSILAAPLTLDICRLLHLSSARGESGVQTQLSPFFKHPIGHTRTSLVQEYLDLERHYGI